MATSTIFTDTGDGFLQNFDNTYANARDGIGSFASPDTTNTFLKFGQSFTTRYDCFETFLAFDTSALYGRSITSVVLSLNGNADSSDTDFTMEAYLRSWTAGGLTTGDWVPGGSVSSLTLVASLSTASYSNGYMDFTSQAAFNAAVSSTASTELVVVSSRFRANTTPTGNEHLFIDSADAGGGASAAKLTIVHEDSGPLRTVPSSMRW